MSASYSIGDRVLVAGGGDRRGVIVANGQYFSSTFYYQVLLLGDSDPVFLPQDELELIEADPGSPAAWLLAQELADAEVFGAFYTLLKLRTRLSDHLYSYLSSRTVFRVYQFKPVLKLLESPHQRLLIADEVGLGKTIEAGLIWSELDARTSLDRVLIVCPAGLRRKWQLEMDRRFDRDVPIIWSVRDLDELLEKYRRQGERSRFSAIAGLETMRGRRALEMVREVMPALDLVIVDEAHHMRNRGRLSHDLGQLLSDLAEVLIFLTATPLNLGTDDLFNLINLLVPEEFESPGIFEQLLEPNEYVNQSLRILRMSFPPDADEVLNTLRKVERTRVAARFTRSPYYQEAVRQLGSGGPLTRRDVVELQRKITELNALAQVYSRTRKRDLNERFAMREAATLDVEWTESEWAVYEAATTFARVRAQRLRETGAPLGFVTIMPQRQAASCLPVMRDYLLEAIERRILQADFAEGEEDSAGDDEERLTAASKHLADSEISALSLAYEAAQQLGSSDSKFDAFERNVKQMLVEDPKAQILVFSFFRRTLSYLERRLRESGITVSRMDGDTDRRERERLMDAFRAGNFQMLLSSEIGAEGLDFEFCRFLVNYDLPWNPMRLEQRIGRLDRFGQVNDKITIVNFRIDGTIESDIFERLYDRIGIFTRSIGELEPILGDAMRELERTLMSPELSPEQQRGRAETIAQAIEARKVALDEFEQTKVRLVGQDDYVVEQLNEVERSRRYITPEELERLFRGFLEREVGGRTSLRPDKDEPRLLHLTVSGKFEDVLRQYIHRYGPAALDLLTSLSGGGAMSITFHPEVAYQRLAEFLNLRHPFMRAIIDFYEADEGRLYRAGKVQVSGEPKGEFLFFIYLLEATGIVPRHSLLGVAVDPSTAVVDVSASELVLPALSAAELQDPDPRPVLVPDVVNRCFEVAQAEAFGVREKMKEELERTNEALAVARQESLRESLRIRGERVADLLARSTDTRITRMREAQLRNLSSRVHARIDEIESRKVVSVSLQPLAGGFLKVV